jgi:hypothetical protein
MTSRGLVMTLDVMTFEQQTFKNRLLYPTRARPNAFLIQHIFLLNTDVLKHQGNHYV